MYKNPVFNTRSKHIEIRHHFIRDLVNKEDVKLEFINTGDQPGYMLAKANNFWEVWKVQKVAENYKLRGEICVS